jgi:hypothetical protein
MATSVTFSITTTKPKISSASGPVRLDKISRGTGAAVVMRVGEGNAGIAVVIRFILDPGNLKPTALLSATTIHGETISGSAVNHFIEYEPPAGEWSGGAPWDEKTTWACSCCR